MIPKTFRIISILLILMIIAITFLSAYSISTQTPKTLKRTVQEKLISVASVISSQIDGDAFAQITNGDEGTQNFIQIRDQLWRVKQSTPGIHRIYTLKKNSNEIKFVVDGDYGYDSDAVMIGQAYPKTGDGLVHGFTALSADNEFTTDERGTFLSGYAPIKDSRGMVVGIVGVTMDSADVLTRINYLDLLPILIGIMTAAAIVAIIIIERRRGINEYRSEENERNIDVLLNAVPDDLALINSEKKIITINKSMAEKLGTSREALTGRPIGDFITSSVLCDTLDQIHDPTITGRQIYFEEKQNDRWLETSVNPVTDRNGTNVTIAIQSRDITQRKLFEEELKREGLSQIEHNIEKFQMLNDQIRNPLQVIKGYLSLVDTKYNDNINKQIGIIDNLVTQLDMGWLESEKVQQFLLKHSHYSSQSSDEHLRKGGLQ